MMVPDIFIPKGSYDAATVVALTAQNATPIFLIGLIAFIGGFLQQFGAIWAGFRDRSYGIPLICTLWSFAHDMTYLSNWRHWMFANDLEVVRWAWVQMLLYGARELTVGYQILSYGRREAFPGMSLPQVVVAYVLLQLFAFALLC
nr:hypothetical protein [Sphingomonas sp. CDS-1]